MRFACEPNDGNSRSITCPHDSFVVHYPPKSGTGMAQNRTFGGMTQERIVFALALSLLLVPSGGAGEKTNKSINKTSKPTVADVNKELVRE